MFVFFGLCLQSREKKITERRVFIFCISGLVCLLFTSFDGRVRKKKMGGGDDEYMVVQQLVGGKTGLLIC
jgi:hypothetical protein